MAEWLNPFPFSHSTDGYLELGTPHAGYASILTSPPEMTTLTNSVFGVHSLYPTPQSGSITPFPVALTSTATITSPPLSFSRSTPDFPHSAYPQHTQYATSSHPTHLKPDYKNKEH
ncbi:hypothetical protein MJO29_014969 [Puccinia striiformis f. sp. tritici]|nr:hypothetical protein MJO29_014969 [Puccinia striiformis f. sp. tritici]